MVQRHHDDDPLARIRERMPVLCSLAATDEAIFEGVTIAVASHLEPKTGVYVEALRDAGATVLATPNNVDSTHEDVVEHLDAQSGISVFGGEAETETALDRAQIDLLGRDPDLLLTDGGELLVKCHADPELSPTGLCGVAEQTTSGVSRARAMATDDVLDVPVFAVNHTPMKHWFDNVHGTGESAVTNIALSTNTVLSGRTCVVAGYGYVGRGIATKLHDIGASTVVTEVDPRKALQADMDGHRVLPMDDAAAEGDLFITATGNCHVIRERHFERMHDGVTLCNAGHRSVEIDIDSLDSLASDVSDLEEGITRYTLEDGREIDLLADGELVNLAGPYSQGHPASVMDSTFASMFVAARELVESGETYGPGVHELPEQLDREVAEHVLDARDIDIDSLTDLQETYLDAWQREDVV
jgi:adenosylhomocysteinase